MIFQLATLALLVAASYTDLKERRAPNKITAAILIVSLPLIYTAAPHYSIIHAAYLGLMGYSFYRQKTGAGDLKALVPITLSLATIPLLIFVVMTTASGLLFALRFGKTIPLLPAIAIGYAGQILFFVMV